MSEYPNCSIKQTYEIISKYIPHGIDGYRIDKKYLDPRKMVEQKKNLEKSMKRPKAQSLKEVRHKSSYFEQLTKDAATLPSPSSYQINQNDMATINNSKTYPIKSNSERHTIFQELQKQLLKNNFPSSANYNINPQKVKDKKGSYMKKAEISTCIQQSIRNSIEVPGIGQYNAKDERLRWLNGGGVVEWKLPSQPKIKKPKLILPGVGAYSPKAINFNLFQNSEQNKNLRNQKNGNFNKSTRWKKAIALNNSSELNHNIISEWGIKGNNKRKDILDKVSRPNNHRSIYY